MTQKRSSVTRISRPMMMTVTHHDSSPSRDSPMRATPVSALSAIGSATLPNVVTRFRLRARYPSRKSVTDATMKTTAAA